METFIIITLVVQVATLVCAVRCWRKARALRQPPQWAHTASKASYSYYDHADAWDDANLGRDRR